jgi:protein arginine kinase activator
MQGKICQICQQKVAKIHITQIHGSNVLELHVCPDCSRQNGLNNIDLSIHVSLTEAVDVEKGGQAASDSPSDEVKTCAGCGQTYRGFKESGRMGCWQCYDTFAEELEPLLRKIQAGIKHIGKTLNTELIAQTDLAPMILKKKELLRLAVTAEDFETAARLRDEIKSLESQVSP